MGNQNQFNQQQLHENSSCLLINCLEPLLKALHWSGTRGDLFEALPYYALHIGIDDLVNTMQNVGYSNKSLKINLAMLDSCLMPCLFIAKNNTAYVILDIHNDQLRVFNSVTMSYETISPTSMNGTAYLFTPTKEASDHATPNNWFFNYIYKMRGFFVLIFFSGFILSLLALGLPIFSMAIYNQVIVSASVPMLAQLLVGILIAITGAVSLQYLNAKIISFIGMHINSDIGSAIFSKLLSLSPGYIESATISSQVARIKDLDNIRQFFTSPLFGLIFEIPFTLTFMIAIAVLGGNCIFAPLLMIVVFALTALVIHPKMKKSVRDVSQRSSARQDLTLETLQQIRHLKFAGMNKIWYERYRAISAEASCLRFKHSLLFSKFSILADTLTMLTAVAIIALGAFKIIAGTMSAGALVAVMMLVWRTLTPFKMLFSNQINFDQTLSSIKQLNVLMSLPSEKTSSSLYNLTSSIKGSVRFNRVNFRYPQAHDSALVGVSFQANLGEVIALVGRNGSGKSTIFKLILGLYPPQAGNIYVDNRDIRQYSSIQLRRYISYVPQKPFLFYGSIAQNIYLANPSATEEEFDYAIKRAHLLNDILAMPDGFETWIDDRAGSKFSSGFLQRVSLARAYLKKSSIVLLDEPSSALDKKSEKALIDAIQYFRTHATIFMITHRPSHINLADKIILIHEGQLLLSGETEDVMKDLPKEFFP